MCALQTKLYAYNSRDYFAKRNVQQIFLQLCAAFQFNVESYRLMVSVGFSFLLETRQQYISHNPSKTLEQGLNVGTDYIIACVEDF